MTVLSYHIQDDVPLCYSGNCMFSEIDGKTQPRPSYLRAGVRGEQIPGRPSSSPEYGVAYLDDK